MSSQTSSGQSNNGTVINQQYVNGYGDGSHAWLIATLASSTVDTYDHLHLVATFDSTDASYTNSAVDITFGNRAGFSYTYTAKGATPIGNNAHLAAYAQNDGSVNLYFMLNDYYDSGTYTILEAQQETVYQTPQDFPNQTPPGTLVFDTGNPAYQPALYTDLSGDISFPGKFVGNLTTTGNFVYLGPNNGALYSDTLNTAIQPPAGGSIYLAPVGLDGTRVDSTGSLRLGGGSPYGAEQSAHIIFADGSTQSTAALGTQSANGIINFNNPQGNAGFQFEPSSQTLGGTFGAGGNLTLQANSPTNTTTGGDIFLGGSQRGDASASKVVINGNVATGAVSNSNGLSGLTVNGANNVGIGLSPFSDPSSGMSLEVNGSIKLTAGSGASLTFPDGSVQAVAWNGVLQGGDYAESVDVTGERSTYQPGDVLIVDQNSEGRFIKSDRAYSTAVMGIYSTRPGVVGRRQTSERSHMSDEVPMAMIGVVPTKVTVEGGPIRPGDLLVTSSTPGYAMRGTDRSRLTGAIIGKALGHLESATGMIEVAVSLQ